MLGQPLSDRLQSKSVKQSTVSSIARDFNLTRFLAEAHFSQISDYFLRHAEVELGTILGRYSRNTWRNSDSYVESERKRQ